MTKISFRADDDLLERVEHLEGSKSEVMRRALRAYLDGAGDAGGAEDAAAAEDLDGHRYVSDGAPGRELAEQSLDAYIDQRVDARVKELLDGQRDDSPRSVSVTVSLGDEPVVERGSRTEGTVTTRRCECGESLDGGWAYCPDCGRPAPTATGSGS